MNANQSNRRHWHGLVLVALVGFPGAVRAEDDAKVTVQIWTIRATRAGEEVSPQLRPLVKALQTSFKFSGYTLVKADTRDVPLKKSISSSLTGPFKIKISPTEKADGKITLQVEVTERQGDGEAKKLNTIVSLKPERFQLFGGWKLEKDDVLIVAVSAK